MSSITTQQTKLDLELIPKENILNIGKCNGRIPRRLTPREPTFQVVLDAIAHFFITQCYPDFSFTADGPLKCINPRELLLLSSIKVYLERLVVLTTLVSSVLKSWGYVPLVNIDYMELLWEDFIYQIENKVYKKQEKMYYPRFSKVIIHHFHIQEKSLSWRNKIGMHTSKDDYLINSLRFVSAKESSQIYGAVLPEYEEPVRRKRVKRSCQEKKSSNYSIAGIVFKETPVKTKSTRKEKVDVSRGKGIDLLSEVALAEKSQLKEVRKKSLRDFHTTHPSGSGTVIEKHPSVEKITPIVTSEGTGDKPGYPDVTEDDSTKSESES
ncbi:hypothetical protein Tco_0073314 [Tanacetum coccineum]